MKKMLIEYSMKNGLEKGRFEGIKKKLILPVHEDGKNFFVTIPDLKPVEYGVVIYTGKDLIAEDLLMKINVTGKKITPSFDWYESIFTEYLNKISQLKITDIVKLSFSNDNQIIFEKQYVPSLIEKNNPFESI